MHIRILEENAYTKQSEENLQEMIRKTKGAESILWMGENLYMLAGKADTLSAVQKKAEKQITAIKKSSRIRTIRYSLPAHLHQRAEHLVGDLDREEARQALLHPA